MLVADDETNPYFQDLCEAAKEIAELKAQISRLEKMVDGVLAQHLAGQSEGPGAWVAPDAPLLPPAQDAPAHDSAEHEIAALETSDVDDPLQGDWALPVIHDGDTSDAPDVEAADHELAFADDHEIEPEVPATIEDGCGNDDGHDIEHTATVDGKIAPMPATGSLPSALRSLICHPSKTALTSRDDLTLIDGIDCATALELAAYGLNRFEDIATLDTPKIKDLRAAVAGAERLHADVWIEQAAILAKGNLTAFARQTRQNRAVQDTPFTLKPELIALDAIADDEAPDFTASEIILDEKITFDRLQVDQAASILNDLATRDLPRYMHIDRKLADIMCCKDDLPSFLPLGTPEPSVEIKKISHVAPDRNHDRGNMRALAASLGAAAIIYFATTTSGVLNFNAGVAQLMETDVCALTSWSSYPDACKHILGKVL